MSITHRVSLQWEDRKPFENTVTKVFSGTGGYFTDIRKYKNSSESPTDFPYEWVSIGQAIEVPPNVQRFVKEIDSLALMKEDRGEEPIIDTDEGAFEPIGNNQERETGVLFNPETNKVESYVEIWQIEVKDAENSLYRPKDSSAFDGMLVKVGDSIQGVLARKSVKGVKKLSLARAHFRDGSWNIEDEYGPDSKIVLDIENAWVPFS